MYGLRFLCLAFLAVGVSARPHYKRAAAFYDPANQGGSMLVDAAPGFGEPLNVIISGYSSSDVLTDDGIVNYARAIGFSTECLGFHIGAPQSANLGDGNGWVNQIMVLREDYSDPLVGTCVESLIGGNHFRVFKQNGQAADSGALFLAASVEEPSTENHTISPDGYNLGRDKLVAWALGEKSHGGVTYQTTAENVTGLLQAGAQGINHDIAIDGIVTVLTVRVV